MKPLKEASNGSGAGGGGEGGGGSEGGEGMLYKGWPLQYALHPEVWRNLLPFQYNSFGGEGTRHDPTY